MSSIVVLETSVLVSILSFHRLDLECLSIGFSLGLLTLSLGLLMRPNTARMGDKLLCQFTCIATAN